MHFKALPPTSFEDITLDFEQVQAFLSNGDIGVDSSGKLAVVKTVLSGQVPLTSASGVKLQYAVGTVALTWTASTTSNVVVVNHPIGRAPQVWFNAHDTGNAGIVPECQSSGRTITQFSAQAVSQVSGSYSVSFDWLAIG